MKTKIEIKYTFLYNSSNWTELKILGTVILHINNVLR